MNNESFSASMHLEPQKRPAGKSSILHLNLFRKALRSLQFGSLSLTWPVGEKTRHEGKQGGVHAEMTILQRYVIDRLITHGDVGLGEDYMAGKWLANVDEQLSAIGALATATVDYATAESGRNLR